MAKMTDQDAFDAVTCFRQNGEKAFSTVALRWGIPVAKALLAYYYLDKFGSGAAPDQEHVKTRVVERLCEFDKRISV